MRRQLLAKPFRQLELTQITGRAPEASTASFLTQIRKVVANTPEWGERKQLSYSSVLKT